MWIYILNSSMHKSLMLTSDACQRRSAVHMDCMHWVNRDSYLPQGSRGLKVRTEACRYIHLSSSARAFMLAHTCTAQIRSLRLERSDIFSGRIDARSSLHQKVS